jgi:hypothetical protein
MKIGIHERKGSFSDRWIEYCKEKSIDYKIVNCYDSNIIEQLGDCDGLLWHFYQVDNRDKLFAKQLLFSLEQSGKVVYPNFRTGWHFDDKVGQKYLFEALGIRTPASYVFYNRSKAMDWIAKVDFPMVFKLRGGAGGHHVKLIKNKTVARNIINKAFHKGFPQFDPWANIKDRITMYKKGNGTLRAILNGLYRFLDPPEYSKRGLHEKGYVYFQDFVPNNGIDYRVEIGGELCTAMVRKVREKDFRASGSHNVDFTGEAMPKEIIQFAYDLRDKMNVQSCALDIIRNNATNELFLIETSFCYGVDPDEFDHGYYDKSGNWYNEKFDGRDWLIESVINDIKGRKTKME